MTELKKFVQRLADPELETLRELLGRKVSSLFTNALELEEGRIHANYFVLKLGGNEVNRFLVLESRRIETPEELLDYYEMHVSHESVPRGIEWIPPSELFPGGILKQPFSSIRLPGAPMTVASIKVLEAVEKGAEESAVYDAGILFAAPGPRQVLLLAELWGGWELRLETREESIHRVLERMRVRRVLE